MTSSSKEKSRMRPIIGSNSVPFGPTDVAFQADKAENDQKLQMFQESIAKASKMTQESYEKLANQFRSAWTQHCDTVQGKHLQWGWINLPGYKEFVNNTSKKYHKLADELNHKAEAAGLNTVSVKPQRRDA